MSTTVDLRWKPDTDAEFVLRDIVGLDWAVADVSLSEIDWRESANNCARLSEPLLHEVIADYHASMTRGDVFPMVVVEQSESGYIILGGNQRTNAVKQFDDDSLCVKAYVVEPLTSSNRELIIRSLNSRHGAGATKQERIQHAVYLVQEKGVSIHTAARAMCVHETSIALYIKANETRAEIARKGVDCSKFTTSHLVALARVTNDARKMQIAKAAELTRPTADQLAAVASAVESSRSDAAAQKVIATHEATWHSSNKVRKCVGPATNKRRRDFLLLLDKVVAFLETGNGGMPVSTMDDVGCSPKADGDAIRVQVAKIVSRLSCIVESGK